MNVALARKRHESFCLHYMSTMNGSQAALAAGYSARNPKNAHIIAWTLLKREDVRARLEELRKAASDDAIMTLIQMKIVLSQIAGSRLADYYDKNGHLNPLAEGVPNPHAVASVEFAYDPIHKKPMPVRLRLHDKIDAIVELCKLDGAYKKKSMSVTVAPITSATVVEDARTKLTAMMNKLSIRIAGAKDGLTLGEGKQEEASG